MTPKILIIGSTGELGSSLLNYCSKNNISINACTCYKNHKKISLQKNKYFIKNIFTLSLKEQIKSFKKFITLNKFHIVYFLDYGYQSIEYLKILIKKNINCNFAIANKELIITGGSYLIKNIKKQNYFTPLDSEHFSLFNEKSKSKNIKKIYITASGGPFFFKKNKKLNYVSFKEVITHPKWKMGINNSIDSSNFINKILEIFELSSIYNISLDKIDFVVSRNAYIHSIVFFNDDTISLNCFKNDMLIPLKKPLSEFFNLPLSKIDDRIFNLQNFKIQKFNDNRFAIIKYLKLIKNFKQSKQIEFLISNNLAHEKYIKGMLAYSDIVDFIFKLISGKKINKNFNSYSEINKFINKIKYYES